MSASVHTLSRELVRARPRVADYLELTKPRLNFLVLATTLAGFYLGTKGSFNEALMINTLVGTALVAGSASALNQLMESEADARMRRTAERPLPSGRLQPHQAFWFGLVTAFAGTAYLSVTVNLLAALLAGLTWFIYLFAYTPLKTETPLNTVVGAVPGAIPPVIGWAAARDSLSLEAFVLFGILFLWQFPHFLAIAWLYREDYERGGFKMLSLFDRQGVVTGHYMGAFSVALFGVSLLPSLLGLTGGLYLAGALLLGAAFAGLNAGCAFFGVQRYARLAFFASVVYLPLLLALATLDKA